MGERFIQPEEIARAEEMMSDEQRAASEARAKFKIQEVDSFDEQIIKQDDIERRRPTLEEKEQMDRRLVMLGTLFEESGVRWQLDGALNISLMQGEYIGIHKDVDLSVDGRDLEKLDGHLEKRGYGLFLSYPKDANDPKSKRIYERVSARTMVSSAETHSIVAIDEKGGIKEDNGELNFIDLHVFRNEEGKVVNVMGVELPEAWYQPNKIVFQGTEINLSHPAKIAFFKLHDTRAYDQGDIKKLVDIGKLSLEDTEEVKALCDQEIQNKMVKVDLILGPVVEKMEADASKERVLELLLQNPMLAGRMKGADKNNIEELARQVSESEDKSLDRVREIALNLFGIDESIKRLKTGSENLVRWVKERK